MSITKKVFATILKDIGIAFHMIGIGSASKLFREYSIAKANYYYNKTEKNIKKWLVKIDQIIEANNVTIKRKVVVVVAYLKDIAVDWYKANKTNIN